MERFPSRGNFGKSPTLRGMLKSLSSCGLPLPHGALTRKSLSSTKAPLWLTSSCRKEKFRTTVTLRVRSNILPNSLDRASARKWLNQVVTRKNHDRASARKRKLRNSPLLEEVFVKILHSKSFAELAEQISIPQKYSRRNLAKVEGMVERRHGKKKPHR